MNRNIITILFLLFFSFVLFCQPDEGIIITVMDFETSGISENEGIMVIDLFSNHLMEVEDYIVIDRSTRETALIQADFEMSDCEGEECYLKIGRMLSANRIIFGSLGLLGSQYLINMKFVETETGETLSSFSESFNSIDKIIDAIPVITEKIVPKKTVQFNPTSPEVFLNIQSETPHAEVYINDIFWGYTADDDFRILLENGYSYTIRLEKRGFNSFTRTITLVDDIEVSANLVQDPLYTPLTINCSGEGASVLLDDRLIGNIMEGQLITYIKKDSPVRLQISRYGYDDYKKELTLSEAKTLEVELIRTRYIDFFAGFYTALIDASKPMDIWDLSLGLRSYFVSNWIFFEMELEILGLYNYLTDPEINFEDDRFKAVNKIGAFLFLNDLNIFRPKAGLLYKSGLGGLSYGAFTGFEIKLIKPFRLNVEADFMKSAFGNFENPSHLDLQISLTYQSTGFQDEE